MTGVLVAVWLVLAAVPFAWWLTTRRRVDVWRALPVPAALLDAAGRVQDTAGPASEATFTLTTGVPARGHVVRTRTADGTPVAVSGVRGGALVLSLPRIRWGSGATVFSPSWAAGWRTTSTPRSAPCTGTST